MAKKRKFKIERNRKLAVLLIIILVCVSIGAYLLFSSTPSINEEDTLVESFGENPSQSFLANAGNILNPRFQFFAFVDVPTTRVINFEHTRQGGVHRYSGGSQWAGSSCQTGEVIRLRFCSGTTEPINRNTCTEDIFDKLWQVHRPFDFPNFRDFYTSDMDFYYTFDCYDPRMSFADDYERKFLFNGKCVSSRDSGGNGVQYSTELFCLQALEQQQEREERKRLEQEERERQEQLRIDNLRDQCIRQGGSFNRNTQRCVIPEPTPTPTPQPPQTGTDENTQPPVQDDETNLVQPPQTGTDENTQPTITVTCRAYQEVRDGTCSFSGSKLFSDRGVIEYWEDEALNIIGALFLIVVVIVFVIPAITRRGNTSNTRGKK